MRLRHPILKAPRDGQRRDGSRRSKGPAGWVGQGTAWIVHDVGHDCYHCYWLVGRPNDHLIERATRTERGRRRRVGEVSDPAGENPSG